MKNFLSKLSYRVQVMMRNIYGPDALSIALLSVGLVFSVISGITKSKVCSFISTASLLYSLLRCYSKNYDKRRKELAWFMEKTKGIRSAFSLRKMNFKDKEHCYFKCPGCGCITRVPKGKGKIRVSCPKCGNKFEVNSK